MKGFWAAAVLLGSSVCLHGQAVDATVCEILKSPQSFDGKTVRVKGTVAAGFDQFVIRGVGCGQRVNAIWLAYPAGTKGKAGPAAVLELEPAKNFAGPVSAPERAAATLDKSKDFKQFDSALAAPYKTNGMCLGCGKNTVTATLVGRLDGVADARLKREGGKIVGFGGFGNLNAYSARLVLESVSDVAVQAIDYSKSAAVTKDEPVQEAAGGDPVAAAHKLASAFGAGNPAGTQIEDAASAFGKQGDNNGVEVGFGPGNEVAAKSEGKGDRDSPDGVLYNCTFNGDRLKGDALSRAMVNIGAQIANLRHPPAGYESAGIYEFEYRAWATTVMAAIAASQKSLTLPGGVVFWSAAWAPADRDSQLNQAIMNFLGDEELLTR
jgi:hypothetical protein